MFVKYLVEFIVFMLWRVFFGDLKVFVDNVGMMTRRRFFFGSGMLGYVWNGINKWINFF